MRDAAASSMEDPTAPAAPAERSRPETARAHATAWAGPGGRRARREQFTWRRLLWRLILPERGPVIFPTAAGGLLLLVMCAVASAAYNTGNNILFLTLALLVACLVLSAVLAWLNYSRVAWRLVAEPPFRAGEESDVVVEMRNDKRVLPTYALSLELEARMAGAKGRLHQHDRLAPGESLEVTWTFKPARRGIEELHLAGVSSLYPFGFLRKHVSTSIVLPIKVWPVRVAYEFTGEAPARWQPEQGRQNKPGGDADLLGLRRYQAGDSHRTIHWKASARLGKLLVRQNAVEIATQFSLWLETCAARWPRPEQFELVCSFAATLAEDLLREGRLGHLAINAEPPVNVRRVRELESFLDRLAELTPAGEPSPLPRTLAARNEPVITFEPEGERGVCARIDGEVVARA